MSKDHFWKEFGRRLNSNYSLANKVFWQTNRRLPGKSLSITTSYEESIRNIPRNEEEILLQWSEYFKNLLNPVRTTPTDTPNTIDFGKKEVFTLTEVTATERGLKSGKTAGEDKIRPKMLKELNEKEMLWFTRMYQVAWRLEKTPKDW